MKHLKLTSNQNIVTVALNRPEKRNAFHPEMIQELTEVFTGFHSEDKLRAVVLTGEGESFCSGGDLEWMRSMASFSHSENLQDANRLFDMFSAIRNCPVPVVGKVAGHCFGGGAGLVAVCDIVAAELKTQFCFSEVKWGLVPAVISPFVVERAHAGSVREWFTTAKVFLADEAMAGGLINFSGNISDVDIYIEHSLKLILNAAPEAVRETKSLHQSYTQMDWNSIRYKVTGLIADRRVSAEGQKGLQAFLNKTTPVWNESPHGSPAKI